MHDANEIATAAEVVGRLSDLALAVEGDKVLKLAGVLALAHSYLVEIAAHRLQGADIVAAITSAAHGDLSVT